MDPKTGENSTSYSDKLSNNNDFWPFADLGHGSFGTVFENGTGLATNYPAPGFWPVWSDDNIERAGPYACRVCKYPAKSAQSLNQHLRRSDHSAEHHAKLEKRDHGQKRQNRPNASNEI